MNGRRAQMTPLGRRTAERASRLGGCLVAPSLALSLLVAACDADGDTPNCSDAGECFTPPGDSAANVSVVGSGGGAGTSDDAGTVNVPDANGE